MCKDDNHALISNIKGCCRTIGGVTFTLLRTLLVANGKFKTFQLLGYTPELNPEECVWYNLKNNLANEFTKALKI